MAENYYSRYEYDRSMFVALLADIVPSTSATTGTPKTTGTEGYTSEEGKTESEIGSETSGSSSSGGGGCEVGLGIFGLAVLFGAFKFIAQR